MAATVAAVTAALCVVALSGPALASTAPGLGAATSYAVLAGTTVTNTNTPTTVSGDLGVSPGSAVTGFPPGTVSNGSIHKADQPAADAQAALGTAYDNAASSPCNFDMSNQNLGGKTLTPGTYCQSTAPTLTGTLTLDGNGVFIFKVGSTLVTAPNATIAFTNRAQPCNVFWQVSSSATLDTGTTFAGTVMALTSIGMNSTATLRGRALARNGAVTLDNNTITAPTSCAAPDVAGSTATPAPSGSASASPGAGATPAASPSTRLPRAGGGPPSRPNAPWILVVAAVALGGPPALALMLARRRSRPRRLS
jgi:hypothetical protein